MRIKVLGIKGEELTTIHTHSILSRDTGPSIPTLDDLNYMFPGFTVTADEDSPGDAIATEHDGPELPTRDVLESYASLRFPNNAGQTVTLRSSLGNSGTELFLNRVQAQRILDSDPYPAVIAIDDKQVVYVRSPMRCDELNENTADLLVAEIMLWLGIDLQWHIRMPHRAEYTYNGSTLCIKGAWSRRTVRIDLPPNATRIELFQYITGKLNTEYPAARGVPTNGKQTLRMSGTGPCVIRIEGEVRCYVDGVYIGSKNSLFTSLYDQYAALRKADSILNEPKEEVNV